MWRGVVKGSHMGSWWETRLEYEIPRNRGRISRGNTKGQVGGQRLIKRYTSNGQHTRTSGLYWLSVLDIGVTSTTESPKTLVLRVRPNLLCVTSRPRQSSSNQFENRQSQWDFDEDNERQSQDSKRQSQWDFDEDIEVIFPVDFPALTPCTRKTICVYPTSASKTDVRTP
jgi:hypothetical protein